MIPLLTPVNFRWTIPLNTVNQVPPLLRVGTTEDDWNPQLDTDALALECQSFLQSAHIVATSLDTVVCTAIRFIVFRALFIGYTVYWDYCIDSSNILYYCEEGR